MTAEVFCMPVSVAFNGGQTVGQHRAEALAMYDRRHDAEDLVELHPKAFQRMLNAARDDWHAKQKKAISGQLLRARQVSEVEALATSNKWGPRL